MLLHGVEIALRNRGVHLGTEVISGDVTRDGVRRVQSRRRRRRRERRRGGRPPRSPCTPRDARAERAFIAESGSSFLGVGTAFQRDVAVGAWSLVDRRDGSVPRDVGARRLRDRAALAITRGGEHIPGSPFALTVVPGSHVGVGVVLRPRRRRPAGAASCSG